MRNRLASLIVVKQEPSNSLGNPANTLNSSSASTPSSPSFEINNNQIFNDNPNLAIKTELNAYEINNNHIQLSDSYNYSTYQQQQHHHHQLHQPPTHNNNNNSNKHHQLQQTQHHLHHSQIAHNSQTTAANSANLIYPCRNLFPDGCDISHHNHLNCSNFSTFNSNVNESTTLLYNSHSDRFILKSEPLSYELQHQQQHLHNHIHQQQQLQNLHNSPNGRSSLESPSSASSIDNQWCLTNLSCRKQFNQFHNSSSPDYSCQKNSHNNNSMYLDLFFFF